MAKIHVLDKHTAELIAAGEVVERPSSVVKEMVENAVDAGATNITIEIKDGGISYIRISDNGCGIAKDDVPKAFLRHATSKILTPSDLEAIGTLGFRGEALASIAAVSRVEILTKTSEETFGTHYIIEGGEEKLLDDAGCPNGTTFVIQDLFYNTPARMKFLKKNVAEGNAVSDVIDRLALSHPEISFKLIRDGKQTLSTPGDGKLLSAIHAVYGSEFASSLIPVSYKNGDITISGYTCMPVAARKNRSLQLFYINGRFVKTGTGSAALQEAYKNAIMVGKFPAGVYHLQFPCDQIDVNVHPAKIEVRFSNERAIFDVVYFGVKSALESGDKRPTFDLKTMVPATSQITSETSRLKRASSAFQLPQKTINHSVTPVQKPIQTKFHMVQPNETPIVNENRLLNDSGFSVSNVTKAPAVPGKSVSKSFVPSVSGTSLDVVVETTKANEKSQPSAQIVEEIPEEISNVNLRIIGEAFKTYVLVEVDNRILVMDKHAAHERILFDRLKESEATGHAQILLEPLALTMRKEDYTLLLDNKELLEQAGILIDSFGETSVRVVAVPMNLENEDICLLMDEIIEKLRRNSASVMADRLDWLYHSIACRSAVKGGYRTSDAELMTLAKRIVKDESILYCPHGRPVAMWLTKTQLEKQFGRSGN